MHHSFVVEVISDSRISCLWLDCLLYLAGIYLDPGQFVFPVHQYDRCQNWTHASCAHVTGSLYEQLDAQVEFSWYCPSLVLPDPYMLAKLFDGVLAVKLSLMITFRVSDSVDSTLSDTESPNSPVVVFLISE